jgi:hypothetical protein
VNDRLLSIYLNDHLAGATAGLELVRRAAGSNRGTTLGDFLAGLATEIGADREALRKVMSDLGIRRDPLKIAGGWAGEKLGRLKLNGQLTGYSPLSRLIELEGLHLGITGKLELWRMLKETGGDEAGVDLEELIKRADGQRRALAPHRKEAARAAFLAARPG